MRLKCKPIDVASKISGCVTFNAVIFYAAESECISLTMTERLDILREERSSMTPRSIEGVTPISSALMMSTGLWWLKD